MSNRIRSKKRHDHVTIALGIMVGADYRCIRVHDWNETGFNFHFDQEINEAELRFRRGTSEFSGDPVWTLTNADESVILEVILNNTLMRELRRSIRNEDLIRRVHAMVRAKGLLDEKKKFLAYLGCEISPEDEYLLIQSYKMKYPRFRHGVRIKSDGWSEIVKEVLHLTSVVNTLDKLHRNIADLFVDMDKES